MMIEKWRSLVRLAAGSGITLFAASMLGVFSGCDSQIFVSAISKSPFGIWLLPLGGLVGIGLGLLAFLWDRHWAQHPGPVWRRNLLRIGYASLWILLTTLIFSVHIYPDHASLPIEVPLRLDRPNSVTATFTPIQETHYILYLGLRGHLPEAELDRLIADWFEEEVAGRLPNVRPKITCTVNDQPVDISLVVVPGRRSYWGEYLQLRGVEIGELPANIATGRQCTITVRVVQPASLSALSADRSALDARFEIGQNGIWSSIYNEKLQISLCGTLAGLIGFVAMLYSLSRLFHDLRTRWVEKAQSTAPKSDPYQTD